jgi:hypothetical protein
MSEFNIPWAIRRSRVRLARIFKIAQKMDYGDENHVLIDISRNSVSKTRRKYYSVNSRETQYTSRASKVTRPTLTLREKLIKANKVCSRPNEVEHFYGSDERVEPLKVLWQHTMDAVADADEHVHYIEEIAKCAQNWSFARHQGLVSLLKYKRKTPMRLSVWIDSLNYIYTAKAAHAREMIDEEAEEQIWRRYAVEVKDMDPTPPRLNEIGIEEVMATIREEAQSYFLEELEECINSSSDEELTNGLYYLAKSKHAPPIFKKMLPFAEDRLGIAGLKLTVIPRLLLLCCIQKEDDASSLVTTIFEKASHLISSEAANAVLEYSAHLIHSSAGVIVLNSMRHLVTVEGTHK